MLSFIFYGCTTSTFERVEFPVHTPKYDSWEKVFQNPENSAVIETWNTGKIEVDMGGLMNASNEYFPYKKGEKQYIDVPVYYISTQKHGSIIIDAGINMELNSDKDKYLSGLIKGLIVTGCESKKGESLKERLDWASIKPNYLFLTHMHYDHIAGLIDLDISFPVIVAKDEKEVTVPLMYSTKYLSNLKELSEIDFAFGRSIHPFNSVVDVFGDNTLFAMKTGGHTDYHVSYLLNSENGVYLFPGDQLNTPEQLKLNIEPGSYSSNTEQAKESFDMIKEFLETYPEVHIMYSHYIQ